MEKKPREISEGKELKKEDYSKESVEVSRVVPNAEIMKKNRVKQRKAICPTQEISKV